MALCEFNLVGYKVMAENNVNSVEAPEISIILATKGDKLGFLKNCIESLEKQKFSNFEIIVVSKKFPKQLEDLFKSEHIRFLGKWIDLGGGEKLRC